LYRGVNLDESRQRDRRGGQHDAGGNEQQISLDGVGSHHELKFEPLQSERARRKQHAINENGSKHGRRDITRDVTDHAFEPFVVVMRAAHNAPSDTGVFVTLRLGLAVLTLGIVSVVTAADDPTQLVVFEPGATSTTINGSVTGYRSLRYVFAARAGQILSFSFVTSKKSLYFNVLQGTHMLHDGSSDDAQWFKCCWIGGSTVCRPSLRSGRPILAHNLRAFLTGAKRDT